MKNILFYVTAALSFPLSVQGAETPSLDHSIPLHVVNKAWREKKELEVVITYTDRSKEEERLILEEATEKSSTQKTINIPHGNVRTIKLYLYNYHENPIEKDLMGTLIASGVFKSPPSPLKEITFIIRKRKITATPAYMAHP